MGLEWGTNVGGFKLEINFSESVKILSRTLDSALSTNRHTADVRVCNSHIGATRHIRPCLTIAAAKISALRIVAVWLNYCNTLF